MILSVCLNPTIQKTLLFEGFNPGGVNRAALARFDASGKGVNLCRVLGQLAEPSLHLTQVGGRFNGFFLEMCAQDGIPLRQVESGSEIRFCHTVISKKDGRYNITELVEEAAAVSPGTEEKVRDAFAEVLPQCECLVISGTKAAGFSDSLYPDMVRQAKEAGKFVVLDIRGKDLLACLQHRPDLIKPNLDEFLGTFGENLTQRRKDAKVTVRSICAELHAKYDCQIVLTRGAEAVWFFDAGGFQEQEVQAIDAINPIGSGDAFTAALARSLLHGASLQEAVAEAGKAGAMNARQLKPGCIR
ncbi:MAG: PfkB family carbohydrate kinase [Spirochaetaceae bacterium]|jgi:1-phosphofructokinase/tagatose 6-phosphate kinase|nr:PfkB family carbohydrate kinase [Spirochaetaceae bacterium]